MPEYLPGDQAIEEHERAIERERLRLWGEYKAQHMLDQQAAIQLAANQLANRLPDADQIAREANGAYYMRVDGHWQFQENPIPQPPGPPNPPPAAPVIDPAFTYGMRREFPGWRIVEMDEIVLRTDRVLLNEDDGTPDYWGSAPGRRRVGEPLTNSFLMDEAEGRMTRLNRTLYRKVGGDGVDIVPIDENYIPAPWAKPVKSKPKAYQPIRIPMDKNYSRPLPLP